MGRLTISAQTSEMLLRAARYWLRAARGGDSAAGRKRMAQEWPRVAGNGLRPARDVLRAARVVQWFISSS